MLHPTRQREGFAGRTSPGAAFAAAGTLVLHGPRSSAVAVVWGERAWIPIRDPWPIGTRARTTMDPDSGSMVSILVLDARFY